MPVPNPANSEISPQQILATLKPFGIILSDDQCAKVQEYGRLLLKWNRLTSLTTVTDPVEIVGRHFGESMFAASLLPVENGRLVDIGSGAGFPGLALKIFCPQIQLTLVESNKKKCAFLAEVIRTLELPDAEVLPLRFEEIRAERDFANFITARAVGGFPRILRWARTALSRRGHLLLWVGGEDITSITNSKGWIWNPPARIPQSQRRFILVGRYVGESQ
ncbi:MAG: 16S rRNA (guanine(527)-N(7))-methyltransferase RsmG [Acidobacteriia bacterium]|nr:16S rRNA (guanine(527)-N(7))-methyltransferase RsmG [Terriglobia bacterium]